MASQPATVAVTTNGREAKLRVDDTGALVTAGGGGGGGAVTIADGADVNAGATTDLALTTDAAGTLSAKERGLVKWAFERMPVSLGQKLMAASFPVAMASDQPAMPVNGTVAVSAVGGTVTVGGTVAVSSVGGTSQVDVTDEPTRDLGKVDVASLDQYAPVAGRLPVDGSGVTQPVSGTVTANAGSGTLAVSGPLTDTQLRATPVPVSGTVTANQGSPPWSQNLTQIASTSVVTGGVAGSQGVGGLAAQDAAIAGNPNVAGAVTIDTDDTAPPNRATAEARTVRLGADRDGSAFVRPHGPQVWSYHEDSSSALTDASVHVLPGSGLSLYVGTIVVSTGAATAMNIFFEEGAAKVLGPYYLEAVAGRGLAIQFNPPKKITANTALTVTTSAAIAHSIDVTGFVAQG